ncbi:haloacid dehalogenase, partial [bacterium]
MDTETPQLRVWQEIYRSYGATLLLEEWVRCLGTSAGAFDVAADLRSKTSLPFDGDALVAQFRTSSGEAIL